MTVLAGTSHLNLPADRQLDPVVVAPNGAGRNQRTILEIAEPHAWQVNAVDARVEFPRSAWANVEPELLALQVRPRLIHIAAVENAMSFQQRRGAMLHACPPC